MWPSKTLITPWAAEQAKTFQLWPKPFMVWKKSGLTLRGKTPPARPQVPRYKNWKWFYVLHLLTYPEPCSAFVSLSSLVLGIGLNFLRNFRIFMIVELHQLQQIWGYNLIIPRTRSPTWKLAISSTKGYLEVSSWSSCSSRQGLPGLLEISVWYCWEPSYKILDFFASFWP